MQPFTYSTHDVLAATDWTMNTFQSHLRREAEFVIMDGMTEAGRGVPRRFAWRGLIQFVAASEMIRLGIEPSQAFKFSAKVAFSSVVAPGRIAGYPFPYEHGETMILIAGGEMNIATAKNGRLELWKVPGFGSGDPSFRAINFTKLHQRTCDRLEIDAARQMREVYSQMGA